MKIRRHDLKIAPDRKRVLIRPFIPDEKQRVINIIGRVMALSEKAVKKLLVEVLEEFGERHDHIIRMFERHFGAVRSRIFTDQELSEPRRLLIGSYFTSEYSLESAALFNPSIVPHPDQSDLSEGELRFIMSLRATGEGHISSIEFRSGIINANHDLILDPVSPHVTTPEMVPNASYDKKIFAIKLREMGFGNNYSDEVLEPLDEKFTHVELRSSISALKKRISLQTHDEQRTLECIVWLAESNYEVAFHEKRNLSEQIIFPNSDNESNGIEDARFVRFTDDNGEVRYYATYTAYNGRVGLPQIIETDDFLHFKIITLNGPAAQNKDMALFPRKINGSFAMISRQDDESIFLMFSNDIHFWFEAKCIMKPAQPWEAAKTGCCGSPIETEAGWLLLTHGVGPMRKYCIGAILLDIDDPGKVVGRLSDPLISPNENEREGYVPNVVYTCGGLLHDRELIIPYAMSDYATSVASVNLDELLAELTRKK